MTDFDDETTITSELHRETSCVSVRFCVRSAMSDYWIKGDWDIPERYDQIFVDGAINNPDDDENYRRLLNLLREDDRKWKDIVFEDDVCNWSPIPDLLEIVTACFGKVDYLHFWGDAFSIDFVSTINAGLAMENGVKGVYIAQFEGFSNELVRSFAHSLRFAQNLEYLSLELDGYEDDNEEDPIHAQTLIHGLHANTTLQELELVSWMFPQDTFSQLVSILQSCESLRKLDLRNTDLSSALDQALLRSWLANENCQLESLKLHHDGPNPHPEIIDFWNLDRRNTSLEHLRLGGMTIEGSSLSLLFASYANLISLDLRSNEISDLEPFDSLLLTDDCILESLILSANPISAESIVSFARKLPRMKVLRNLELSILNDDHGAMRVLADAVLRNASLERIHVVSVKCDPYEYEPRADWILGEHDDESISALTALYNFEAFLLSTFESDLVNRMNHALCLNRGGRRQTACNPGSLPLNLLPIAIFRASKSRYHKVDGEERKDEWDYYPSSRSGGLDAIFWLLRENSTFISQCSFNPKAVVEVPQLLSAGRG